MKTFAILNLMAVAALASTAHAQRGTLETTPKDSKPPTPPPVHVAPGAPAAGKTYVYEQKPLGGHRPLVSSEQAQAVIDKFKAAYPKLGSPRLVIYVNRELVDEQSGLKVTGRTENTDTIKRTQSGGAEKEATEKTFARTKAENRMRVQEKTAPALADKQTVRDVERLFGRPLRIAGASLADQRVAAQLIGSRPAGESLASTEGEQARKDREALQKIADVAIEILISSRNVTVGEVSGDKTYSVPDIQATAIRLEDAKIMGQASASDLIGEGQTAGYAARTHDVREITEATALALMEDMAQGVE